MAIFNEMMAARCKSLHFLRRFELVPIIVAVFVFCWKVKGKPRIKELYSFFRIRFATIYRCTTDSCGCKTRGLANRRGGWSTRMPNQENQPVGEPLPWRPPNTRRSEDESKRRYSIYPFDVNISLLTVHLCSCLYTYLPDFFKEYLYGMVSIRCVFNIPPC